VVVDPSEPSDDLVQEVVEVLSSLCARLYGRRGARNRALRALTCAKPPGHTNLTADPTDADDTDTGGGQR
jgi:hypothetical protein